MKKIIMEKDFELTYQQLRELADILEQQETTDRDESGYIEAACDYGKYKYTIDEDYNIILKGI